MLGALGSSRVARTVALAAALLGVWELPECSSETGDRPHLEERPAGESPAEPVLPTNRRRADQEDCRNHQIRYFSQWSPDDLVTVTLTLTGRPDRTLNKFKSPLDATEEVCVYKGQPVRASIRVVVPEGYLAMPFLGCRLDVDGAPIESSSQRDAVSCWAEVLVTY